MFSYLPCSVGDVTCLLGSFLPPLLGRRTFPRDRPRPGHVGEEQSDGCSDECEEAGCWDCQRSQFDQLEPVLKKQTISLHTDGHHKV